MRTIPLGGQKAAGRVALVDDEDYEQVMAYRWHVRETMRPGRRDNGPYAAATVWRQGRAVTILMHKLLTGWPQTDHVDHDGLNNQRINLRPATASENGGNRRPNHAGASPFKGVYWDRQVDKWRARIRIDRKWCYLGWFAVEEDAAQAYDTAALLAWGAYAHLNFPRQ
jgi:hypothetical protein